jgi:hypothetical protein
MASHADRPSRRLRSCGYAPAPIPGFRPERRVLRRSSRPGRSRLRQRRIVGTCALLHDERKLRHKVAPCAATSRMKLRSFLPSAKAPRHFLVWQVGFMRGQFYADPRACRAWHPPRNALQDRSHKKALRRNRANISR